MICAALPAVSVAVAGVSDFELSGEVAFMERLKTLSRAGVLWLVAGSALLTVQCLSVKAEEAVSVVPAWQRFRAAHLTSEQAGRLLISELNCQSDRKSTRLNSSH